MRAAFLSVPLVELVVAIVVGRVIGAGWTILALLALSVVGGMVIKRAGLASLRQVDEDVTQGRAPGPELAGTGMVLMAGLLLFVPGFVTGVLGLALLLPPVRARARRPLEQRLKRAAADRVAFFSAFGPGLGGFGPASGPGSGAGSRTPGFPSSTGNAGGVVITGEVIDDPGGRRRRPREPGGPTP